MPSVRKFSFLIALLLASRFHSRLEAQKLSRPRLPSSPGLVQLVRKAGYVFEGTVLSVARVANLPGVATVQITFRIDRGIRGTRTGQTLIVREWAGLWGTGERYRRGDRVVLFLYPPSKLGLTSPVGGALGRFAVDPNGFVNLHPERAAARSGDPAAVPQAQGRNRVSAREFSGAIQRSLE